MLSRTRSVCIPIPSADSVSNSVAIVPLDVRIPTVVRPSPVSFPPQGIPDSEADLAQLTPAQVKLAREMAANGLLAHPSKLVVIFCAMPHSFPPSLF